MGFRSLKIRLSIVNKIMIMMTFNDILHKMYVYDKTCKLLLIENLICYTNTWVYRPISSTPLYYTNPSIKINLLVLRLKVIPVLNNVLSTRTGNTLYGFNLRYFI